MMKAKWRERALSAAIDTSCRQLASWCSFVPSVDLGAQAFTVRSWPSLPKATAPPDAAFVPTFTVAGDEAEEEGHDKSAEEAVQALDHEDDEAEEALLMLASG